MALISWQDKYSVNIREIDDQHKKLIDMINELHDAMMAGQGKEVMTQVLDKLASYCVSHFATEERLMSTHGFPGFDEHKEKHEKMTAKVKQLQQGLAQSGTAVMSNDVMTFLKSWLDKHIMGTDHKYAPFLNDKGVN